MYMELAKQLETEMEYWQAVETLEGYIWRMNHDLADERIQDSTGGIAKEIQNAQEILASLVSELEEKFGVIPPEEEQKQKIEQDIPQMPEGKQHYWGWYKKMEKFYYQEEYEKIICSACPFSNEVEEMIKLGGKVLCGKLNGKIYRLARPYECHRVTFEGLAPEQFCQEIFQEKGEAALVRFKTKEAELKARCLLKKA